MEKDVVYIVGKKATPDTKKMFVKAFRTPAIIFGTIFAVIGILMICAKDWKQLSLCLIAGASFLLFTAFGVWLMCFLETRTHNTGTDKNYMVVVNDELRVFMTVGAIKSIPLLRIVNITQNNNPALTEDYVVHERNINDTPRKIRPYKEANSFRLIIIYLDEEGNEQTFVTPDAVANSDQVIINIQNKIQEV